MVREREREREQENEGNTMKGGQWMMGLDEGNNIK